MPDTIRSMELRQADLLSVDSLMVDDLIGIENEVVKVLAITSDSTGDNYSILYQNDFAEEEEIILPYNKMVPLYIFVETD